MTQARPTSRKAERRTIIKTLAVLALALGAAGSACDRSPSPATQAGWEIALKQRIFLFNTAEVDELVITKNDPTTEDRWSARFKKNPGTRQWEIAAGLDGKDYTDLLANTGFINHLLDTLSTLQADEMAPEGTPDSFGLAQPHYLLQWGKSPNSYTLKLGAEVEKNPGRYGTAQTGDKSTPTLVLRGAALEMLSHVRSFDYLRRRTALTLESDDVDEIELRQGKSLKLYSQRQGDDWVDRKKRKLRVPVQKILDQLTHARIRHFIDDPERSRELLAQVKKDSLFSATLRDRQGRPTDFTVTLREGRVLAAVSSRPGTAFELYPDAIKLFQLPK